MPTIGHIKVGLADSDTDFASDDFDRDDLVPLVLSREEDALDVRFRFAAMGRIYVSLGLRVTQAAIARVECVDATL